MTMILGVIGRIWDWLVSFTGTAALIFVLVSAVLIRIEAGIYSSARRKRRREGDLR